MRPSNHHRQEGADGSLWKVLSGGILESGWTGPSYPNRTTDTCCFHHHAYGYCPIPRGRACMQSEICVEDCGKGGCLFDVMRQFYLQMKILQMEMKILSLKNTDFGATR